MLENERDIIRKFACFGFSSWVSMKNIIFDRSLDHLEFAKIDRSDFFSIGALRMIGLSLWSYMRHILSFTSTNLYLGAGSGIFCYHGVTMDGHLPIELSTAPGIPAPDILYFLSANHVDMMYEQREFLRRHDAFIYSFIISPLKIMLARFFLFFYKFNQRLNFSARELSDELASISVHVSVRDILTIHARFCAGYILYRVLLFPFKIKKAFIVSAYSTSEICAVLRKMGVEVTEVQHGLIGPTHRGYNYAVRDALLPTPQKISVYTDFWGGELIAAGYYVANQISIDKRLKYTLAEAEQPVFNFPYIVFTGQGILLEEVSMFISEFSRLATSVHLVYVPHPNEGMEYVSKISLAVKNNSRVHIVKKGVATTERLIIDSRAHVSIYSSCHFDAIHYKRETYVLDVMENNLMKYYMRKDPASFISVRNGVDMLKHLEQVL